MKELIKQYRGVLILVATLFGVGVFSYFGILPVWNKNNEIKNAIQAADADKEILSRQSQQAEVFRNQVDSIKAAESDFNVTVSKEDPLSWVKTLEGLAQESGVSIKIETTGDQAMGGGSIVAKKPTASKSGVVNKGGDKEALLDKLSSDQYISVKITLQGDYLPTKHFIQKLELMKFFADIISFDMMYSEPEKSERNASSIFTLSAPTGSSGVSTPVSDVAPQPKPMIQTMLTVFVYTR